MPEAEPPRSTAEDELASILSEPYPEDIAFARELRADVLVLAAGGKMGPILARRVHHGRNSTERMSSLPEARREYDRQADAYDSRWSDYLRRSTEPLLRLLDLRSGDRLLDVGCGTGVLLDRISRRWPASRLYGIDPSGGMLRQARQRVGDRGHLVQGDAAALPFADRTFGTVVSTSSLRYWPDAGPVFRQVARVLQPEGQFLLLDWCGDAARHRLLGRWLTLTGRVGGNLYRQGELEELLAAAGFRAEVRCIRAGWYWRFTVARATLS